MLRLSALLKCFCMMLLLGSAAAARAADGYELWLRYQAAEPQLQAAYARLATSIVVESDSPTLRVAAQELRRGIAGTTGSAPASDLRDGAILVGTPAGSSSLRQL